MKKQDFTKWLRYKLYDLPTEELERILQYYSDAIADRMEDGMTEEEAVDAADVPSDNGTKPEEAPAEEKAE